MDLREARLAAKALLEAVRSGDQPAAERICTYHPKHVGHARESLDVARLTLRDAQASIAAEHRCDGWEHFVSSLGGAPSTPRWRTNNRVEARSFTEARQRGDTYVTGDHLLLALLAAPQPSIAATILRELGHTHGRLLARMPTYSERGRTGTTTSTPRQQVLVAAADALALACGARSTSDEHVLIALVYEDRRAGVSTLVERGIDPDEVFDALVRFGVAVPPFRPPVVPPPAGPRGPMVTSNNAMRPPSVERYVSSIHPARSGGHERLQVEARSCLFHRRARHRSRRDSTPGRDER